MSERPVTNLIKPPRLAACDCLNCGGGIEFDASDFTEDETRTAECPHCHKETSIFVEREKPVASINSPTAETDSMMPKQLSDFIGQNRVKARLELAIAAARQRGEALNHILLIGSPGSGKATLANIIARAMGANVKATTGPTLEKSSDLAGLLTNLEEGDVLFIDEIQRLQKFIEKYLYPAMEDYKLDIIVDVGEGARSVRLNLPRFTLIGATTNKELLKHNLLSRFGFVESMDDYSVADLDKIVIRSANLLNVEVDPAGAHEIACRSRGTPLDVMKRLRHVRDYAQ